MQLHIPELSGHASDATYFIAGAIVVVTLISISNPSNSPNLENIPTVGSTTWLGSWWAGIKFIFNATNVLRQGYEKYKGAPFKVSTFYRWMVIVSGPEYVEEFRKSGDDKLNLLDAVADMFIVDYTLGHDTHYNPYHIRILRSGLNRNLGALCSGLQDEVAIASDEILDLKGHEWKSIPALSATQQIVCRSFNRAFVGIPLCRDPDWVNLNIEFAMDVIKVPSIIGLLPRFMAPLVARFITNLPANIKRGAKHLDPIFEARRQHLDGHGPSEGQGGQPNDIFQWLLEGSEGSQRNVNNIASRILSINFAAIHTSSNVFTQMLYNLAESPQYIQELRDEVEPITREEGWSNASVAKMHKVDSFMKETQRMNEAILVSMIRKAANDITFSDGTVIPRGTFVAMASQPMHFDNEVYENAEVFDPFRFANMRAKDPASTKHQFSATSPDYLVFGHGRHACPGRFFAASVLSTMLARFVISYDIKLKDNATRPKNWHIGTLVVANPTAQIMIRRRVET